MADRQRRNEHVPPHNLDAEQALLGSLLMSREACDDVRDRLTASDFYRPANQHVFDAIMAGLVEGNYPDAVTVAEHLRKTGLLDDVGGPGFLIELQAVTPAISHASRYADTVLATALARRVILLGGEISRAGYEQHDDPARLFEVAREQMARVEASFYAGDVTSPIVWLDEIVTGPPTPPEWIVPGILHREHRMYLAATAGAGKSTWLRALAIISAAGFHPFLGTPGRPVKLDRPQRWLIFDLENNANAYRIETRTMERFWRQKAGVDRLPVAVHAMGSRRFDPVGNRTDRLEFWSWMQQVRPDGVILGPAYKAAHGRTRGGDRDWSGDAMGLQALADEAIGRYGCGWIFETHVASANDARPRGAQEQSFWAELVPTLVRRKNDPTTTTVTHSRGRRFTSLYGWWPEKFVAGPPVMKFIPRWPEGTFTPDGTPMWDIAWRGDTDPTAEPVAVANVSDGPDPGPF